MPTDVEVPTGASLAETLAWLAHTSCLVTDSQGWVLAASDHRTPPMDASGPGKAISEIFSASARESVAGLLRSEERGVRAATLRCADGEERGFLVFRVAEAGAPLVVWEDAESKQQLLAIEETCRFQSSILSSLSHEFRNPLHAILSAASCLADDVYGELNPQQDECVRDAHEAAKHLLWLSRQILDATKLDAGGAGLERAPVVPHDLIETAVRLVRDGAAKKRIELTTDEPNDVEAAILADGRRLAQVLVNLIGNAVKYTPEGGKVIVGFRADGPDAVFFVSDTGIGIDAKDHGRIFEPFERAEGGAASPHDGAGLGLALAKRIVEKHGGKIGIRSARGEGSVFAFRVPFVPDFGDVFLAAPNTKDPSQESSFDWRAIFR
jgi:signal transduction histidine kinase